MFIHLLRVSRYLPVSSTDAWDGPCTGPTPARETLLQGIKSSHTKKETTFPLRKWVYFLPSEGLKYSQDRVSTVDGLVP